MEDGDYDIVLRKELQFVLLAWGYCAGEFCSSKSFWGQGFLLVYRVEPVLLGEIRTKTIGTRLDQCTGWPILFY